MSTTPCGICVGPPVRHVVWLADLTRAARRQYTQWYSQRCATCGVALRDHQTHRHPHGLVGATAHCVAFRPCTAALAGKEVQP